MNADGLSDATQLTNEPYGAESPTWSPDSTQIAYQATTTAAVTDLRGSTRTVLTDKADRNSRFVAWSPDGSRIAFSGDGRSIDMPRSIYVVGPDGSGLRSVVDLPFFDVTDLTWSPDGRDLLFTDGNDVYVADTESSRLARLTTFIDRSAHYPAWSPDGGLITFSVELEGTYSPPIPEGLWVMKSDGSNITQLVSEHVDALRPAWSADGSRIAATIQFLSEGAGGNEVIVVNADGSGLSNLTRASEAFDCVWVAWSPKPKD